MAPDAARAARAALAAAGYRIDGTGEQNSFDTDVRRNADASGGRRLTVPLFVHARDEAGQEIKVAFAALPDGPQADSVSYTIELDRMTPAAFAARVAQKYGEPAQRIGDAVELWCAGPGRGCPDQWNHYPNMKVDTQAETIELTYADDARDAALAARVDEEAGRRRPQLQEAGF